MTSGTAPDRLSPVEIDEIRAREAVSSVFERFGHKPRRSGRVFECLCPFHVERTPSCMIDDQKGSFFCHGCGKGGDVITAVIELRGCTFPEAIEFLGGPRQLSELDVARIEKRKREREEQDAVDARRGAEWCTRLWNEGQKIRGTHAHAYLEARGLSLPGGADLRFAPALPYRGFVDAEAIETRELGIFPAMLGAIRSNAGALIGVHRTYLDPVEPVKLRPPGDPKRNRAKKIAGEQRGGSITLSSASPRMVYGEGIETTLSWRLLAGAAAMDLGFAALVSLGNISGGAAGSVPHPTKLHPNGKPIQVPNGEPDLDRPGFVPAADVEEAILLGDGDSDAFGTRMRLLTAAKRWRRDAGRTAQMIVRISMAPTGCDFNDVLCQEAEALVP